MISISKIVIWCIVLNLSSFLLSKIEKINIKKNNDSGNIFSMKSLARFKNIKRLIFIFASIESVCLMKNSDTFLIVGLILVFLGMVLRIAAIKSLGKLWSYHVKIYKNHYLVKTGVYKYFGHPAYIGNIHIVGLVLLVGSPISALLSLAFIVCFYFDRAKIENKLLLNLE